MGRDQARWIAVAAVVAAIIGVAVAVSSREDPTARDQARDGSDVDVRADDDPAEAALDGPHVNVELCTGVVCPALDADAQVALADRLEADPRVASIRFVSSERAYQLFLDRFGDDAELVASVQPDQVPARVELDLYDVTAIDAVIADWTDQDGVARVEDARIR